MQKSFSQLPLHSGDWGRRIAPTQEEEVAVSWDHAIALQPRQQGKIPSQKKKNQKTKKTDADKIVEKKECLYITGGSVN